MAAETEATRAMREMQIGFATFTERLETIGANVTRCIDTLHGDGCSDSSLVVQVDRLRGELDGHRQWSKDRFEAIEARMRLTEGETSEYRKGRHLIWQAVIAAIGMSFAAWIGYQARSDKSGPVHEVARPAR